MIIHAAEGAGYRLKRGTRLADLPPQRPMPPVPPLADLDGPLQLAEYLALMVKHDPHDVKRLVEVPSETKKGSMEDVWIYEHLRRIPIDLTPLVVQLLSICSRESCPDMRAQDWTYVCAAHGSTPQDSCCAIDYVLHMLDSTTALLNSSRNFPSRLQIPPESRSHFPHLFRRLARIFAHAYHHHREAFYLAESEMALYARFVALCEKYQLVGDSLLFVPAGSDAGDDEGHDDVDENDGRGEGAEDDGEAEDVDMDSSDDDEPSKRGRDKAGATAPRSHSLGRHPDPEKREIAPLPSRAHERQAASAEAGHAAAQEAEGEAGGAHADVTAVFDTRAIGRGTLGRGKTARGKVLWTPDKVVEDEGDTTMVAAGGAGADEHGDDDAATSGTVTNVLPRSESSDSIVTAIHEPLPAGVSTPPPAAEPPLAPEPVAPEPDAPVPVPKDELELLAEAGKDEVIGETGRPTAELVSAGGEAKDADDGAEVEPAVPVAAAAADPLPDTPASDTSPDKAK